MSRLLLLFMATSTAMIPGAVLLDPGATSPDIGEGVDDLPDDQDAVDSISDDVDVDATNDTSDANDTDSTDDADSTDPDEPTPPDELEQDDAVTHVDEDVRITAWEHDGEAFHIRFEVDSDRPVTLDWAEMIQRTEGSGSYATSTERLLPGTQTVTLPVEPVAGEAGVTLETSASREDDSGTYLSTGVTEQQSGPWSTTSSAAGWFGGLSVALSMMIAAAWQQKRRSYDKPEDYQ